jgi:hypothetical protein
MLSDAVTESAATMTSMPEQLPTFDQLAGVQGNGPAPGCGWIWGKEDEVGTLNILTPDRVAAAAVVRYNPV